MSMALLGNERKAIFMEDDNVEMLKVRVMPDGRVDRPNAAVAFGRSPKTLAEWKCKGIGPRPINVGGRVFYDWQEVRAMARGELPLVRTLVNV